MAVTGYRYQSEFALRYVKEGEAIGEARGEARAVLMILETRGVAVRMMSASPSLVAPPWISSGCGFVGP